MHELDISTGKGRFSVSTGIVCTKPTVRATTVDKRDGTPLGLKLQHSINLRWAGILATLLDRDPSRQLCEQMSERLIDTIERVAESFRVGVCNLPPQLEHSSLDDVPEDFSIVV